MKNLIAALSLSALVALGGAGAAVAKQPKTTICHPVGSATGGNTHAGYSIITTANPSSHIDEETGAPKHEHDGRVDFVVDADHPCPPSQPSPTPSPTPEPSPTPSPEPSASPTPPPSKPDKPKPPQHGPSTPVTGAHEFALAGAALALAAVGVSALWLGRKQEDA